MESLSIFDVLYDEYKIKNKIRLIEFFAGYGSQAYALKMLGTKFEHYRICEWAMNSIIAYADLHRNELPFYNTDFSKPLTKEEIAEYLYRKGVSIDYNKPATLDQLKRTKEDKLRLCYNAIQCTRNLVDISRVKGKDLEIEDTEMFTYLLTYSFPCQDLSLAGKGAGMEKGSGTRSGLLWEVERILSECENKPQILLMENVSQIHNQENMPHFKEWQLRLEEMGYQSYWEDLSAVDFGIPQTRNRTFMISILGDYNYKFPKRTKLKLRLKDLLESNVDEKYYLSKAMIDYVSATGGGGITTAIQKSTKELQDLSQQNKINEQEQQITSVRDYPEDFDLSKPEFQEIYNKLKNSSFQQQQQRIQEKEVCDTLLARDYKDPKLIIESNNKNLQETLEKNDINKIEDVGYVDAYNKTIITDGTAKTILTGVDFRNQDFLLIKNATKKGYLEAQEGDGIDISSRMESHRGTVQKDKAQTITTMGGENVGVVVGTYDYAQSETFRTSEDRLHLGKDVSGALLSSGNHNGIIVKEESINYTEKSLEKIIKNIVNENDVSGSLTATGMVSINHDGCQLVSLKRGYDVEVKKEKEQAEEVDFIGNYSKSNFNQTSIVGKNGLAPTVTENHGQVTAITEPKVLGGIGEKKSNGGTQYYQQDRIYDENCAISVTTSFNHNYQVGLRIRKLTPKECFRLMGLKDEDIDLIMEHQTNASGYHLAGDSIVSTCLMAIFGQLLDIDYKDKFNPEEWWNNKC